MGVKPDNWIRSMCATKKYRQHGDGTYSDVLDENWKPMIEPFVDEQVKQVALHISNMSAAALESGADKEVKKVISYGNSSYGYDCRIGSKFKVFTNTYNTIVDPKNFDPMSFVDVDLEKTGYDSIIVPPNSFALGRTVEWFRIPRDILVIGIGKSTYARCGIILNVTPFEPEWEGYATLEISNTTPLPAKIYANEGICQLIFFQGDGPCDISYADKKGKYQSQTGIVLPKV